MNDPESLFFPETAARRPLLIAGPCSAETEEQLLTTARALAAAGVGIFRAGVWTVSYTHLTLPTNSRV